MVDASANNSSRLANFFRATTNRNRILQMSRLTTPDALDIETDEVTDTEDESLAGDQIKKKSKKKSDYIVSVKVAPKFYHHKNKYDAYLKRTEK